MAEPKRSQSLPQPSGPAAKTSIRKLLPWRSGGTFSRLAEVEEDVATSEGSDPRSPLRTLHDALAWECLQHGGEEFYSSSSSSEGEPEDGAQCREKSGGRMVQWTSGGTETSRTTSWSTEDQEAQGDEDSRPCTPRPRDAALLAHSQPSLPKARRKRGLAKLGGMLAKEARQWNLH